MSENRVQSHKTIKRTLIFAAALVVVVGLFFIISIGRNVSLNQPDIKVQYKSGWATEVAAAGLNNCYKVSDDLYRGAQPTEEGIKGLQKLGVKTIVNLRSFHSDGDEIADANVAYEHLYVKAWHPEEKEVVGFLKTVTDKSKTPVFVHCQHGSDRTGTMCAVYRIAVQNWSKEDALEEMTTGPFGFHKEWQNLIGYIRQLDIEKMKKEAGLTL